MNPLHEKTDFEKALYGDEPDACEWTFLGYTLLAHRHEDLGMWCGYIELPLGHPLFGMRDIDFDVHGSITSSSVDLARRVHRVGFDCGHAGDMTPGMERMTRLIPSIRPPRYSGDVYRTLAYVKKQCELMAYQAQDADMIKKEVDQIIQSSPPI